MLAMFGAILLGYPRHVLFLFWVWAAFRPLILQVTNHPVIRGSNGLFVVVIIGICVAGYAQRRTDTGGMAGILKISTALLGVTLVSCLVNLSPVQSATWFFINYLAFPFVFYVAYAMLDRRHWRYLFGAIIGLTLIQFALNVGWRLGVNPLPSIWKGTYNIYDMAQGTFGTCAHVAYFMMAVLFLLFSALRLGKKYTPWIILLLGVVVLQWYMTYTNHSYIFFVVLLPVYLVISKQSMRVRMACVALVILGAMTFSFLSAWESTTGTVKNSVGTQLTWENLEYRRDRFVRGPKVELINQIAVENASRDPMLWLLGNGPGSGLSVVGMKHNTAFAWEYLGKYVVNTAGFNESQMASISGTFYSGILAIWSDLGAVGYLLYLSIYLYVVWRVALQLIKDRYQDSVQRVLAEGFVMAMLVFLLASLLHDTFWLPYFVVGLWIWAAVVWTPVEAEEKAEDGAQKTEDGLSGVALAKTEGSETGKPTPAANRWPRPSSLK